MICYGDKGYGYASAVLKVVTKVDNSAYIKAKSRQFDRQGDKKVEIRIIIFRTGEKVDMLTRLLFIYLFFSNAFSLSLVSWVQTTHITWATAY